MAAASPYSRLLDQIPTGDHSVEVLGSATRYWVYGDENADVTLVLVHGFRGEHHGLEPVVAQLSGVRIVSPDLPGFGESEALTGRAHNIPGYVEWLKAFVERVAPGGEAVIVGHSFGSIVASAAVADGLPTPRLILINPIAAPALEGPKGILSRFTLGYYRFGRALPQRLGNSLLSSPLIVWGMSVVMIQTPDRELRRWIHDQHHRYFSKFADRNSVVESFEASIAHDVSMVASRIEVPTLLIGADNDPIVPEAAQHKLVDLFADAKLIVLPGVGHLVHYEKPREAATAIVEFLGAGRVVTQ